MIDTFNLILWVMIGTAIIWSSVALFILKERQFKIYMYYAGVLLIGIITLSILHYVGIIK
jgi:uncharacterized membrane protein